MGERIMDPEIFVLIGLFFLMSIVFWRLYSRLKGEISRLEMGLDDLRVFVNISHERLKKEIVSRVEMSSIRQMGGKAFHKGLSVGEVIALHPQASSVLAEYHLSDCSSCSITDNHILGDAARDYGVNIDHLLASLNGLFSGSTTLQDSKGSPPLQIERTE